MKCSSCQNLLDNYTQSLCEYCQIELNQLNIEDLKAELGYQGDLNSFENPLDKY